MKVTLVRDYGFEAAHFLPRVAEDHKCRRVHGHSYRIRVALAGPIDPALGWLVDFADIDTVVAPVLGELDHRILNEVPGLDNPTAEHLAIWLWRRLASRLPQLHEVEVAETADARCSVRGAA
jgi:6-pyruvoyltetrahydropterin/6-carboxytetrahydropterin synthase